MKKILVSLLILSTASINAEAASKNKAKGGRNHAAVLDRSKDHAYSANWAHQAQSPAPGASFTMGTGDAVGSYLKGQTWYYGLQNFTVHGYTAVNMNAPYQGGDAPSWDGPAKNSYRNMRANNESEFVPANDGSDVRNRR